MCIISILPKQSKLEMRILLMDENEKRAKIFKAFCDANRINLLSLLQNGEKCACELLEEINIGQPTLSHHMKILCDAKIVISQKIGKMTFYRLNKEGIDMAKSILEEITQFKSNIPSRYAI